MSSMTMVLSVPGALAHGGAAYWRCKAGSPLPGE
jgi:hypothetical protein